MNENKIVLKLEKARISNTPVYIMYNKSVPKETAMKRVNDGWINISQCFKLENFGSSKVKRHKVLEEEEKVGAIKIEKVSGGWGRFQGSWVSTEDAIYLFKKYSFQNYVNLTLLSFKEDPKNVLPFKQDVKNYEAVTFEFEIKQNNQPDQTAENGMIETNTENMQENDDQKDILFRNMNIKEFQMIDETKKKKRLKTDTTAKFKAIKRLSAQPFSTTDHEFEKYEKSQQKENIHSISGYMEKSPFKKAKILQPKETNYTSESFYEDNIVAYQNHHMATPFNSHNGSQTHELSTFKHENTNNFNNTPWEHYETTENYTPKTGDDGTFQTKDHFSHLRKHNMETPLTQKTQISTEKYKSFIIKALENDQKTDDGVKFLYGLRIPKNIDSNFSIDEEGNTALHWAAAQGNLPLVKYLLEELKSDPFRCNNKGMNCLSKSLFFDNSFKDNLFSGLLTLLPNCLIVQDAKGKLPLHYVVELCSIKVKNIKVSLYYLDLIIKFLSIEFDLPYNKDPKSGKVYYAKRSFIKMALSSQDLSGNTPLHLAAINANFDVYNLFVTLGGEPVLLNYSDESAYSILQKHYNEMVAKYNSNRSTPTEVKNSNSNTLVKNSNSNTLVKNEVEYGSFEAYKKQTADSKADTVASGNKKDAPILKLEKENSGMLIELMDFGLNNVNDTSASNETNKLGDAEFSKNKISNAPSNLTINRSGSRTSNIWKLRQEMLEKDGYDFRKGSSLPLTNSTHFDFKPLNPNNGDQDRQPNKMQLQSKASKLAPLNLGRISSANTILKRSPDPNIIFLSRNNLQNQSMVQSLRNCNSKMNQMFENLNEIYAAREKKLLDFKASLHQLTNELRLFKSLDTFFKHEGVYTIQEKDMNIDAFEMKVFNIATEWQAVLQRSQKIQLTLKIAMCLGAAKTDDSRATKLMKLMQLLQLEKKRKQLVKNMDSSILLNETDSLKEKYINALEKLRRGGRPA